VLIYSAVEVTVATRSKAMIRVTNPINSVFHFGALIFTPCWVGTWPLKVFAGPQTSFCLYLYTTKEK